MLCLHSVVKVPVDPYLDLKSTVRVLITTTGEANGGSFYLGMRLHAFFMRFSTWMMDEEAPPVPWLQYCSMFVYLSPVYTGLFCLSARPL